MKPSVATVFLGAAAAVAFAAATATAQDSKKSSAQPDAQAPATASLAYKPPMRGAPLTRVGGGTRGVGSSALTVNVLAPAETGYTMQEKPTIYWYVSESVNSAVELTITSTASLKDAATPAFETTMKPPVDKGFHALRLADHGIALKPDVEYQWFVAVVRNPARRSNDVIAGGTIKRIADSGAVEPRLKQTSQAQWAAVYAEAGIWYDAIDQLSKQISADPANRQLRAQRAALLEQVGLREAAAFDRNSGS